MCLFCWVSVGVCACGMGTDKSERDISRYVIWHNVSLARTPSCLPTCHRSCTMSKQMLYQQCLLRCHTPPWWPNGKSRLDERERGNEWMTQFLEGGQEERRAGNNPEATLSTGRWSLHARRSQRTSELGDEMFSYPICSKTRWGITRLCYYSFWAIYMCACGHLNLWLTCMWKVFCEVFVRKMYRMR